MAVKAVNASLTNIVNEITEETRIVDETCSMSSGELSCELCSLCLIVFPNIITLHRLCTNNICQQT